jgi:hypothetical protein
MASLQKRLEPFDVAPPRTRLTARLLAWGFLKEARERRTEGRTVQQKDRTKAAPNPGAFRSGRRIPAHRLRSLEPTIRVDNEAMKLDCGHPMFGRVGAPSDKSNIAFGVSAHGVRPVNCNAERSSKFQIHDLQTQRARRASVDSARKDRHSGNSSDRPSVSSPQQPAGSFNGTRLWTSRCPFGTDILKSTGAKLRLFSKKF